MDIHFKYICKNIYLERRAIAQYFFSYNMAFYIKKYN